MSLLRIETTRSAEGIMTLLFGGRVGYRSPIPRSCRNGRTLGCGLPTQLQRELDLPRGCRRRREQAGGSGRSSRGIKYVRVIRHDWYGEVRVVQDIKELRPELHVEVFRNPFHMIVFKHREVQVRCPRPDQDVATGVAAQVEAPQVIRISGVQAAKGRIAT